MKFNNSFMIFLFSFLAFNACQKAEHLSPQLGDDETDVALTSKPLSDHSYLRKLSYSIKGVPPNTDEYKALDKFQNKDEVDNFFKSKVKEYLSSDDHVDKMEHRLEELFQLNLSPVSYSNTKKIKDVIPGYFITEGFDFNIVSKDNSLNSLNYLFYTIVKNNENWDKLLTKKDYFSYGRSTASFSFMPTDNTFLYLASNKATPNEKRSMRQSSSNVDFKDLTKKSTEVSFSNRPELVAGALTTSRFFSRYTNSVTNKNRRRAAAVFRIFLCDDMKATITESDGNDDEILDYIFPGETDDSSNDSEIPLPDKHGTDKGCQKCHYKLDPMGRHFNYSPLVLSPFASPGALVYKSESDLNINIKTTGFGDLADKLVHQSDFQNCQTRRFWNWFVGDDVELNSKKHKKLVDKYEMLDGRVNDFISYLVQTTEFKSSGVYNEDLTLISNVKNILKKCTSCHKEENIPDFTKWPIGKKWTTHKKWVSLISSEMDITNRGRNRKMPPKVSKWQPSNEDYEILKEWINKGAPSANGKTHYP